MKPSHPAAVPARHLIVSDCDGVLVDSEAIAARIIVERLERLWDSRDIAAAVEPMLGMRTKALLRAVAAKLGRHIDSETIDSIREEVKSRAVEAPEIPGVREVYAALPVRLACASNSDLSYVSRVTDRIGLGGVFGGRLFTADRVAHPKPAPDVYLAASSILHVEPDHCLVIEDSVIGAIAAIEAGMRVLGFVGAARAPAEQAERLRNAGALEVFDDMAQLPALVARWLDGTLAPAPSVA